MKNFETDLTGCRIELYFTREHAGVDLIARGRIRAITTGKDGLMWLWIECECEDDQRLGYWFYDPKIGDVIAYPTDRGQGRCVIRMLDERDGLRKLAQELLSSYQRFAADADGAVSHELEQRAKVCGLDIDAWSTR